MSSLIGAAQPQFTLSEKNLRLHPVFQVVQVNRKRTVDRSHATQYPGGYTNEYWPGNRAFMGDAGADVSMAHSVWGRQLKRLARGAASRVGFVGVARDQYGTPLAGVTCSLFLTSTKQWIMDIVSDAGGNFLLQSWYSPDTHFIVFHKAGSPDVFGTTRQTLVGA